MPVEQPGLYLYRDLEQRLPQFLMPRRREMPFEAGAIVPTMPDLQPGSYEVVKTVINNTGDAKIIGEGAFDFPLVDASASEDRYRVLMCAAGFTVSLPSERHEAFAESKGTLRARQYDIKIQTCIRAIQEKRNRIAAFGDASVGATGLLNNTNVTPDNNSFNPYGASTTPTVLADFFISLVKDYHTNSNNVFYPSTGLISTNLYFRMVSLVMPATSITVKDHVEKALSDEDIKFTFRKVKECESAFLEAAGVQSANTNKDRICLYALDPEVVERHIENIQLAPPKYLQVQGLNTLYPMFGCTTPTIVNFSNAFQYTDVSKS
jgi:hypothetical protein